MAEGFFGQGDVAVALALAGADMEEHAWGIDVAHLEAQAFAQAQTAGIDGDQGHSLIEQRHAGQDGAHFGRGQDDGQLESQVGPAGGACTQYACGAKRHGSRLCLVPEELDGTDGLGGGLAGDLLLALEEDEILAEFLGRDALGAPDLAGKKVCISEIAVHRLKDGKIIEQWGLWDFESLKKQLGERPDF